MGLNIRNIKKKGFKNLLVMNKPKQNKKILKYDTKQKNNGKIIYFLFFFFLFLVGSYKLKAIIKISKLKRNNNSSNIG